MTRIEQIQKDLEKWGEETLGLSTTDKRIVSRQIVGIKRKSDILNRQLEKANSGGDSSSINRLKMTWDDLQVAYENLQIKINEINHSKRSLG